MENTFKKGFVFGTFIGGIGAFLAFSNKTSKMRKELAVKLDDLFEEVKTRTKNLTVLSKESYDQVVDEVVERYQSTMDVSAEMIQKLGKNLKKRWDEVQIFFLYLRIKTKLNKTGEISKEKFNEMAEEIVREYSETNALLKERARHITRRLKDKWSDFKEELEDSDQV